MTFAAHPIKRFSLAVSASAKVYIGLAGVVLGFALLATFDPERFFLAGAACMVLAAGVAGWLFPWTFFGLAVGALILSPEHFIFIEIGGLDVRSLHRLMILAAFGSTVLRHGITRQFNPPLLALGALFIISLTLSDLHPKLSSFQIIKSLLGLSMPFIFINVSYAPRVIPRYLMMICLLPVISVILGAFAEFAQLPSKWGPWRSFPIDWTGAPRLNGMNISAFLAYFGLAALLVCIYEALRTKKNRFIALACLNLVIIMLTGTRAPTVVAMLFAGSVLLFSRQKVLNLSTKVNVTFASLLLITAVAIFYWPAIEARVLRGLGEGSINLSSRDVIWEYFVEAFWRSPWFGRGLGTGAVLLVGELEEVTTAAHNEYLRFLTDAGIVGTVLFIGAMGWWIRSELRFMDRDERLIVLSFLALALFSLTDNTLTSPPSVIAMFALSLLFARARQRFARARSRMTHFTSTQTHPATSRPSLLD